MEQDFKERKIKATENIFLNELFKGKKQEPSRKTRNKIRKGEIEKDERAK